MQEELIWEAAELIAKNYRIKLNSGENIKPPKNIDQFAGRWLTSQWQWAYANLHDAVQKPVQEIKPVPKADAIVAEEPSEVTDTANQELMQKVEEEVRDMEGSVLTGWHIYYTGHRDLDPKHFVEIGGETMEEREEAFTQFVRENGIPFTINPAAIIRGFETVLLAPPVARWTSKKQEVGGEVFDKRKSPRGMRTLFVVDEENKRIVFFIEKKRALEYKFH